MTLCHCRPSAAAAAAAGGGGDGGVAAADAGSATDSAAKEEPPPSSNPTEVTVLTVDGKMLKLAVTPSTTAGDIRMAVAARLGAFASEVRLAYAGVELDPSKDSSPLKFNPKILMLQCMMRMKGGSSSSSSSSSSTAGAAASATVSKIVTAPGAGVHGSAAVQLAKQFRHIMRHPIPGVSCAPDDTDQMTWHVKLAGPSNTPYAGGWFSVQLKLTTASQA
uniref:Ubiquitin-like domain-containing protein n=1 Tax=Tetradesmus obliquus TaxID=3088 RepID=A0A383WK50_TETOB|eukprot:jgi/Sobl393_1/7290/SZX77504.1